MLQFIAPALGFLKGNWVRILLVLGLAAMLFTSGALWSDKKHAEHEADFEKAKAVAIAQREKELNDEWLLRLGEEEIARADLQAGFDALLIHRDGLLKTIRNTSLTKPVEDITIEACVETDDETIQLVIANPFNPDFVRLYNDGSRGLIGTDGAAGPKADRGDAEVP